MTKLSVNEQTVIDLLSGSNRPPATLEHIAARIGKMPHIYMNRIPTSLIAAARSALDALVTKGLVVRNQPNHWMLAVSPALQADTRHGQQAREAPRAREACRKRR
jgi:hypothetical protein